MTQKNCGRIRNYLILEVKWKPCTWKMSPVSWFMFSDCLSVHSGELLIAQWQTVPARALQHVYPVMLDMQTWKRVNQAEMCLFACLKSKPAHSIPDPFLLNFASFSGLLHWLCSLPSIWAPSLSSVICGELSSWKSYKALNPNVFKMCLYNL